MAFKEGMDKIEINDEVVDKVCDNHYFKLAKQLQQVIGLWPYEKGMAKIFRQLSALFFLAIILVQLINGGRVWCGVNLDICAENLIGTIYITAMILKIYVTHAYQKELKLVLQTVAKNWLTIHDPKEREIILKYATLGRMKTVVYLFYVTTAGVVFSQGPLLPVIMDLIKPLNESREKILFVRAEFLIDPIEYYFVLYALSVILIFYNTFIISGIDGFYTIITHQNLAILSIVQHRLQVATNACNIENKRDYDIVIQAIILHKEAIQFNALINATYSTLFIVVNALTVAFISIAAVVTVRILDDFKFEDDLFEIMRIFMVDFGALLHLFYLTWPGQLFLNRSEDLFRNSYASCWYNVSQETKINLRIAMLRFIKPSILSAGGLYEMNFENYGKIIKNAVSYIAVMVSFRG